MGELPGLLILLAIAAGLLMVLLSALLVREARRPPRHTAGYALGRGLPCEPGDLNGSGSIELADFAEFAAALNGPQ